MGELMIIAGLLLMGFGFLQIYTGRTQKEIAPLIPDLAAGNGSPASIAAFQERRAVVFARHGVTDPKKQRALTNFARIIARRQITPARNELVMDLLKQGRV